MIGGKRTVRVYTSTYSVLMKLTPIAFMKWQMQHTPSAAMNSPPHPYDSEPYAILRLAALHSFLVFTFCMKSCLQYIY